MDAERWLACTDPIAMLAFLQNAGRITDRKLRLFAVAVSRSVWSLLTHEQYCRAVEAAEQYADGLIDQNQLYAVLGEEADSYDWLGGVADIAFDVTRPPLAFDVKNVARILRRAATALSEATFPEKDFDHDSYLGAAAVRDSEAEDQAALLRDIFGPWPVRKEPAIDPSLLVQNDGLIGKLAEAAYEERIMPAGTLDGVRLAVLADALEEAGCTSQDILMHLRGPGPHVRGCWALDAILGRK